MASRSLVDLLPAVRGPAESFMCKLKLDGIDALVYCTYRTGMEQYALWLQGRKPGMVNTERVRIGLCEISEAECRKKVTWVPPGLSWHNHRRALDLVPLSGGKCIWSPHNALWGEIGLIGESCGFEWGGRWKQKDLCHFQFTSGLKIQDLM